MISDSQSAETRILAAFSKYRSMISNAQDGQLLAQARTEWNTYTQATAPLLLASSNTTQPKTVALANSSDASFRALTQTTGAWSALNVSLANSENAANASTYSTARMLGIGLLALAIILGIAIAFLLSRSIKRGCRCGAGADELAPGSAATNLRSGDRGARRAAT